MQEQIQRYIRGQLTPGEIDQLWAEFIQDPEWFDYFLTELHLVAIFKRDRSNA